MLTQLSDIRPSRCERHALLVRVTPHLDKFKRIVLRFCSFPSIYRCRPARAAFLVGELVPQRGLARASKRIRKRSLVRTHPKFCASAPTAGLEHSRPAAMGVAGETNGRKPMNRNHTNRPSHAVYVVEGEGDTAYWTKVGSAWPHQDGEGLNIALTVLPLNGRLVVRKPKAQEGAGR